MFYQRQHLLPLLSGGQRAGVFGAVRSDRLVFVSRRAGTALRRDDTYDWRANPTRGTVARRRTRAPMRAAASVSTAPISGRRVPALQVNGRRGHRSADRYRVPTASVFQLPRPFDAAVLPAMFVERDHQRITRQRLEDFLAFLLLDRKSTRLNSRQ